MRFQCGELGFYVCHLPESFYGITRFISRNDTKILWSKSLSINRGTNWGEMLNLIIAIGS